MRQTKTISSKLISRSGTTSAGTSVSKTCNPALVCALIQSFREKIDPQVSRKTTKITRTTTDDEDPSSTILTSLIPIQPWSPSPGTPSLKTGSKTPRPQPLTQSPSLRPPPVSSLLSSQIYPCRLVKKTARPLPPPNRCCLSLFYLSLSAGHEKQGSKIIVDRMLFF